MLYSTEVSQRDSSIIAAFVFSLIALVLVIAPLLLKLVREFFLHKKIPDALGKCTNIHDISTAVVGGKREPN